MIENLEKYFLPEQTFYLHNINYNRIEAPSVERQLNCIDNINVEVNDTDGVKLILTRTLKFDPEGVFELSVSFGAILKFDKDVKNEINWHEINVAEEFRTNGDFVLRNLLDRISLLIAEVTSSFGQRPIIVPPVIAGETK